MIIKGNCFYFSLKPYFVTPNLNRLVDCAGSLRLNPLQISENKRTSSAFPREVQTECCICFLYILCFFGINRFWMYFDCLALFYSGDQF